MPRREVLVTGGTGYLGRALIPRLLGRGHGVRALVRPGSESKLPPGAQAVTGDALRADDIAATLGGCDTVVHLVGVPKPSPAKARQFRTIDLGSIQALVAAVRTGKHRPHVVYLSVAQPAPVMGAYLAVRAEGERLVRELGVPATFVRPWYVLGPGHRWPYLFMPVYLLLRALPPTRATAVRLGFVTLEQMTATLVVAVEQPPSDVRVLGVPEIAAAR